MLTGRFSIALLLLFVGCTGPFYKNRLCEDVGWDLYHTMNYCERSWYDFGMSYEGAQQWCLTSLTTPLPPPRR